jgi:hypothetical protein
MTARALKSIAISADLKAHGLPAIDAWIFAIAAFRPLHAGGAR